MRPEREPTPKISQEVKKEGVKFKNGAWLVDISEILFYLFPTSITYLNKPIIFFSGF